MHSIVQSMVCALIDCNDVGKCNLSHLSAVVGLVVLTCLQLLLWLHGAAARQIIVL